jgi:hypothetical protein
LPCSLSKKAENFGRQKTSVVDDPFVSVSQQLRAIVLFMAVLAFLWILPAEAHRVKVGDPNDVAGRLDLRFVTLNHKARRLIHRVATYGAFTRRTLRPRGPIQ